MRGGLRFGVAFLVAGLSLAPATALAQEARSRHQHPAAESIGPRELQDFSLNGTVTRPADPPPAAQAPPARAPAATRPPPEQRTASETPLNSHCGAASRDAGERQYARCRNVATRRAGIGHAAPFLDHRRPASCRSELTPAAATGGPDFVIDDEPGLAPEQGFALWPWLLAAMALGAGGAFLFWRRTHHAKLSPAGRRSTPSLPPSLKLGLHVRRPRRSAATEAAPTAAVRRASSRPGCGRGSRSTFAPLRCIVEDERVTIEFELAMYNSGSAPARDVLIEASMFNAGPAQDQEIGAFFANPVGEGERHRRPSRR